MGVFDDLKLGQLDWMTQMTETIESDLNELLARLPDRTQISVQDILANSNNYMHLSVSAVVRQLKQDIRVPLTWEEEQLVIDCFKFEEVGEVELDIENETMTGSLFLVKVTAQFDNEDLQKIMGDRGLQLISKRNLPENDPSVVERMNEILEILGDCKEALKGKSKSNKIIAIKQRLNSIFKNNEWRIRDMNLANKVCAWAINYIKDGNMACLVNLTKLKVMTHSNMPIYSIKEEA